MASATASDSPRSSGISTLKYVNPLNNSKNPSLLLPLMLSTSVQHTVGADNFSSCKLASLRDSTLSQSAGKFYFSDKDFKKGGQI